MSREKEARKRHNNGYSCSSSVYSTFSDLVSGTAPFPRSEGGKCGAVLSAEKILQQLGMSSAEFDEKFIRPPWAHAQVWLAQKGGQRT